MTEFTHQMKDIYGKVVCSDMDSVSIHYFSVSTGSRCVHSIKSPLTLHFDILISDLTSFGFKLSYY